MTGGQEILTCGEDGVLVGQQPVCQGNGAKNKYNKCSLYQFFFYFGADFSVRPM